MSDFLSSSEVAKRLNVTPRTIARWIKAGYFPGAVQVNPRAKNSPFIIPVSAVKKYEEERDSTAITELQIKPN